MSSIEDREKHRKRLKRKRKEKVASAIAKELRVSGKYKQRIVEDKRGGRHDLNKMTHKDLVDAIQELDEGE